MVRQLLRPLSDYSPAGALWGICCSGQLAKAREAFEVLVAFCVQFVPKRLQLDLYAIQLGAEVSCHLASDDQMALPLGVQHVSCGRDSKHRTTNGDGIQ